MFAKLKIITGTFISTQASKNPSLKLKKKRLIEKLKVILSRFISQHTFNSPSKVRVDGFLLAK